MVSRRLRLPQNRVYKFQVAGLLECSEHSTDAVCKRRHDLRKLPQVIYRKSTCLQTQPRRRAPTVVGNFTFHALQTGGLSIDDLRQLTEIVATLAYRVRTMLTAFEKSGNLEFVDSILRQS